MLTSHGKIPTILQHISIWSWDTFLVRRESGDVQGTERKRKRRKFKFDLKWKEEKERLNECVMVAWAHLYVLYFYRSFFCVSGVKREKPIFFPIETTILLFLCDVYVFVCVFVCVCLRVYSVGKILRRQWGKVSVLLLFVENGLLTPSETKSVSVCAILRV